MSGQHVNAAWQARLRAVPIAPALTLTTQGLVLGAGTVLVAATAPRRLSSLQGREARVLALLASAYGKPIAPSVLGVIERAAEAWRQGDDCLGAALFPYSRFHIPWIAYLGPSLITEAVRPPDIKTERTPDGGLLMSATEDRLDPANPGHLRAARVIAETIIGCTGYQKARAARA